MAGRTEIGVINLVGNFMTGVRNLGLFNVLEGIFLVKCSRFWDVVQRVGLLKRFANRALINHAIYKMPTRPNPLNTKSDYASWDSLNDRTFSSRHLPPYVYTGEALPPSSRVAELFRRRPGMMRPGKSSVLFTYFAQWFTDGFLRTDYYDPRKNTSNHDIDLSNLYGLDKLSTAALRRPKEEGKGKLKSQMIDGEEYPPFFYDGKGPLPEFRGLRMANLTEMLAKVGRIQGPLPPEMGKRIALFEGFRPILSRDPIDDKMFATGGDRTNSQVGFSAMNVLFLREHNRICDCLARQYPAWDDDRYFETARNIMIAILCKIVIGEYINHITPYQFKFFLEASAFENQRWYRQNWMAVEFNLLYRWHGLTPDAYVFGDRPEAVPLKDTLYRNHLLLERKLGPMLQDASRQQAGRVGVFNTPELLLPVEAGGVEQGRVAKLAPYNDYRELVGLPRVHAFEQISNNPDVQGMLKDLYRTVDRVEYFPGIFSEDILGSTVVSFLIGRIVSVDAFSQALTNPLFSARVFNQDTFSRVGMEILESTDTLEDILNRNIPAGTGPYHITMNYAPAPARSPGAPA